MLKYFKSNKFRCRSLLTVTIILYKLKNIIYVSILNIPVLSASSKLFLYENIHELNLIDQI